MTKKLNTVVSKEEMVKTFDESFKKADFLRWANSNEGRIVVAEEARKREIKERRAQFAIGQLIWKDDLAYEEDTLSMSEAKLVNRCSKIVSINDNDIETEILYVVIDGEKIDSYKDLYDLVWKKGQKVKQCFDRMEKHISPKSGNVWWKVK